MQCLMKIMYFLCLFRISLMYNINDFLKFNGQHSIKDELMVGKNNSCSVSKLVVHVLQSNFSMESLEIWT